ncbi:MAG: ABC transporter permease [Gemmatimonadetes bacterium]|nr:ABC transporter permease [Gemmatimonadota bacterium]
MSVAELLARCGRAVRGAALHAGRAGILFFVTVKALGRPRAWLSESFVQAKRIGVEGLGLVLLMGALSGVVMAQQTSNQLSPGLPVEIVAGGVVAGMLTELGPVLTAIVLAGRMGAGIGAELGTMKVTNQIDALLTLGRDPVIELVVPRVVAGTIILVPLVIMANAMGIFSGYAISTTLLGLTPEQYASGARGYYHHGALIYSLVKAVAFGFTITFTASYVGLRAGGGAAGVGRTATAAVVAIIVWIMVLDVVLAPVYKAVT